MEIIEETSEQEWRWTMNIRYVVELTGEECASLTALIANQRVGPQKRQRAQILMAADRRVSDVGISEALGCGFSTIYRTKKRFVEEGLEQALDERPRQGGRRKLTGREEATLIALACAKPPAGRARWTLELLSAELVQFTDHASVSRETIRRRLAENELKPWQRKMWCIPAVDAEFVARMEDVLDLYAECPPPTRPVICFDETPIQLIGEDRIAIPAAPGRPAQVDYEYRRNGTANLFVFVDAHRPWRHVKVTSRRTATDFAHCMRDLVDVHFPEAVRVRVVLDNLSTHRAKNLYEAFPADEARRILRRLEFHYTPTHASWLNMVEIEISVLASQCLDRRIPGRPELEAEVAAWLVRRNDSGERIKWMFSVERARLKLGKAYPQPHAQPAEQAA
jgi:transposase